MTSKLQQDLRAVPEAARKNLFLPLVPIHSRSASRNEIDKGPILETSSEAGAQIPVVNGAVKKLGSLNYTTGGVAGSVGSSKVGDCSVGSERESDSESGNCGDNSPVLEEHPQRHQQNQQQQEQDLENPATNIFLRLTPFDMP